MASPETIHRQDESPNGPVLSKRLNGIFRTRRVEPTGSGHVGGQKKLIRFHHANQEQARKANQYGDDLAHQGGGALA